ncbi:MAG TPA: hypothetical protein VNT99_01430 [Methylomirabilota bacterium]|nr:hypothetical protein [Methylomirabilota bacterium]
MTEFIRAERRTIERCAVEGEVGDDYPEDDRSIRNIIEEYQLLPAGWSEERQGLPLKSATSSPSSAGAHFSKPES